MICKYLEQIVLFPKDLNWVQHCVSRIGLSSCLYSAHCPEDCGLDDVNTAFELYYRKSRIKRINSLVGNQNITCMRCPIHHDLPDSCDSTQCDYITWFPHTRSLTLFFFLPFFQQEPQKSFNQE